MSKVVELDAVETSSISGGGFFQSLGWAYDNPGEAVGMGADKFLAWYRLTPNEDPNLFIG
ncbi:hypothetical protein SFC76_05425 [Sphingomonas sp. CD22]|uniref:hypothetical protein n=1 Tax=Sphingomonas sp. CD22 TaxID=3100214 RepID=UPI002AE058F8|nr:hypothetical protein [Sphingomonas sp. CD22]MEA1083694.1 hypothetical protein [Sphingomonas sp. CD22]